MAIAADFDKVFTVGAGYFPNIFTLFSFFSDFRESSGSRFHGDFLSKWRRHVILAPLIIFTLCLKEELEKIPVINLRYV